MHRLDSTRLRIEEFYQSWNHLILLLCVTKATKTSPAPREHSLERVYCNLVTEMEIKKFENCTSSYLKSYFNYLNVCACFKHTILVRKHFECAKAMFPKPSSAEPQCFV